MKTPREVLFKRHQETEAKLDAIRENVVEKCITTDGEKKMQPAAASLPVSIMMKLWRELVWPCRRIWAGMAATWVAILLFGLATGERETVVAESAPPSPDAVMALREQRQIMAQLLDANAVLPPTKPLAPVPHSEARRNLDVG